MEALMSLYAEIRREQALAETRAVPAGPVAYRRRLRMGGPLLGLLLPALAVAAALLLWQIAPDAGSVRLVSGGAGWLLAALGLPTAIFLGIPFKGGSGRYLAAAASSAVVWFVLGAVAARRATRSPVASWRDWWREYLWLVAGVWFGVIVGLIALAFFLVRS
jgi:hypothetical protein